MAMNYLEKKREQQQAFLNGQQNAGMRGVSDNTRGQLAQYQNGYQPTDQAQAAQQNLQRLQQKQAPTYSSKYGAALDSILGEIQNPGSFKYDFNGDELFKAYADMYTQNAKQGAMDTMGMNTALTGGYGNSYAQSAAAQAYQQNLLPLYDKGAEFMRAAYDRFEADRANRYNQYGALQDAENADYGRYRDERADYNADLDRATEAARYEDETGYGRYMDQLNYWNTQAQQENKDYWTAQDFTEQQLKTDLDEQYRRDAMAQDQQNFEATNELDWAKLEESKREYDASLSEDQRQYNQKVAIAYVTDILANGQIPSNELLVAAGLSLEDAQKLVAEIGGRGGKKEEKTSKVQALVDNAAATMEGYAEPLGRDTAYLYGAGLTGAVQNSSAFGPMANVLGEMANDETLTPEERKEAAAMQKEYATAAYNKEQNEPKVEAYVAKLLEQAKKNKGK